MPRTFCLATSPLRGLAALLGLFLLGAQSLPAQDGEAVVTLRDAEGYEVPDQGWVKVPTFLLDHVNDSFAATVMDIADTADFDDPTTWSLTEQGGDEINHFHFDATEQHWFGRQIRFSRDDKSLAFAVVGLGSWGGTADINSERIRYFFAGSGTEPGGICFRHGREEVIVWSNVWAPIGAEGSGWSQIGITNVQSGDVIKYIGSPIGWMQNLYSNTTAANVDGSRLYISDNSRIILLDIDSGEVQKRYSKSNTLLCPTGTAILVRNSDGTTDILDTKTDNVIYTFTNLPSANSIETDAENRHILIGLTDGTYALVDTEKPSPIVHLELPIDDVYKLELTGDGIRMGIVTSDRLMHLWDLEMNNNLNFSAPQFTSFSHNGEMYSARGDGSLSRYMGVYSMPPQVRYQSGDLTNGSRTLYVRLRDGEENNEVYTFHYNLDTVVPKRLAMPKAEAGQNDGRVKFSWPTAGDNAEGSGVANYEFIAESAEGACDEHHAFSGGGTSVTVPCPTGQTIYFRVRAIDAAGNAGQWSEPVAYYVNAAPEAPTFTLSPANPLTLDTVTVSASSTDPEGDAIIDTGVQWSLDGVLQSEDARLDPALTAKGQVWTCRARVRDFHGAWSDFSEQTFTIGNTLPSQPIVEIKPDPARADSDLIVDVMQYSIDPDGDTVAYDFMWFKSVDGGATWIHKVELDGLPQVSNLFINDGELWRVQYTPYEKVEDEALAESASKVHGTVPVCNRADGYYAWDQVFIGENHPPVFAFGNILLSTEGQDVNADVAWTTHDADADAFTVNLYCFDVDYPVLKPVQLFIEQGTGGYQGTIPVTGDRNFRLVAIVTDAKGSVTQVISDEQSAKTAARSTWEIYQ